MSARLGVRHSPFALASVVIAAVALARSVVSIQRPVSFLPVGEFMWTLLSALVPPIGGAVVALWLIAKGRQEIELHEGRLAGAVPIKVATVAAVAAIAIAASTTVFALVLPENTIELGSVPVDEAPEPPGTPPRPPEPAEPVDPDAPDVIFLD